MATRVMRFRTAFGRKKAVCRMRGRKAPRPGVFTTGIMPAVTFGAEFAPPTAKQLSQLRTWALQAHGLPTAYVCREAAFAVMHTDADPEAHFVWAPIERWAVEWWERHHAEKANRATLAVAEEHLVAAASVVDPPRATPLGTLQ